MNNTLLLLYLSIVSTITTIFKAAKNNLHLFYQSNTIKKTYQNNNKKHKKINHMLIGS